MAMTVKQAVGTCCFALLLLVCGLSPEANAQTTIRLSKIPEDLMFPFPEGSNAVLTATVQGGKPRWVWLAESRDAIARIMLKGVGDGQYQVNLADPVISAVLQVSGRPRRFQVYAETKEGRIVSSIAVQYVIAPQKKILPTFLVHLRGRKKPAIVVPRLDDSESFPELTGDEEVDRALLAQRAEPWVHRSLESRWFSPDEVERIEARFTAKQRVWQSTAVIGDKRWPFVRQPGHRSVVLKPDDALRLAWKKQGVLRVDISAGKSQRPALVLKAIPERLTIEDRTKTFTLYQYSSKDLPGSGKYLRMSIGDITGGQVMLILLTADGEDIIQGISVSAGEAVRFRFGDQAYLIHVKRLINRLLGADHGRFAISRASQDKAARARQRQRIEALIRIIETSGVVFMLGNDMYKGKKAAEHFRARFDSMEAKIHSVDDFIDKVAGVDRPSGLAYKAKDPDGTVLGARAWLRKHAAGQNDAAKQRAR